MTGVGFSVVLTANWRKSDSKKWSPVDKLVFDINYAHKRISVGCRTNPLFQEYCLSRRRSV